MHPVMTGFDGYRRCPHCGKKATAIYIVYEDDGGDRPGEEAFRGCGTCMEKLGYDYDAEWQGDRMAGGWSHA